MTYPKRASPHALYYYSAGSTTPTKYYYVLNLQGDVVQLRNSSYAVVANYTYDAWGKLLSVTNASGTTITSSTHIANVNPIRYRGYFYDTETKLYYCNSRYYDPQIRRFINADDFDVLHATPGEFTDKNLFAYCDNNPVMRYDRGGEFWSTLTGAIGGAIVGGVKQIAKNIKSGESWHNGLGSAMLSGGIEGARSGLVIDLALATGGVGAIAICAVAPILNNTYKAFKGNGGSLGLNDVPGILVDSTVDFAFNMASYGMAGPVKQASKNIVKNMANNFNDSLLENTTRMVNNQLVLKSTAGVVKNVAQNIGRDVAGDILMKPFPHVFQRYFRTK